MATMDSERAAKTEGTGLQIIASQDLSFGAYTIDDDFGSGFKTCRECGTPTPLTEFRREKKGVGGRKAVCKKCQGISDRKKARKTVNVSNDMIKNALEAAAYRIIKESM